MDRGAWWGYSPQVTESGTRLSDETATPVTCESDLVYKQDLANAHGGGGERGADGDGCREVLVHL